MNLKPIAAIGLLAVGVGAVGVSVLGLGTSPGSSAVTYRTSTASTTTVEQTTAASGTPETGQPSEQGFGSTIQGYTESSNVNIVEEMVNLILAQRAYEVNSKAVQAADEMLQAGNSLKR